jgi:hypothetical protein
MHKPKMSMRLALGACWMATAAVGATEAPVRPTDPAATGVVAAEVAAVASVASVGTSEAMPAAGTTSAPATAATTAVEPVAASDTAVVDAAAEKAALEKRRAEIASKVRNPTLRGHLMDNIDIFGKNDLPAIYILGPGIEEFEGQLLTRDFARDPFFMQNIDREEFEMKMWLHSDFEEDSKKKEEAK